MPAGIDVQELICNLLMPDAVHKNVHLSKQKRKQLDVIAQELKSRGILSAKGQHRLMGKQTEQADFTARERKIKHRVQTKISQHVLTEKMTDRRV